MRDRRPLSIQQELPLSSGAAGHDFPHATWNDRQPAMDMVKAGSQNFEGNLPAAPSARLANFRRASLDLGDSALSRGFVAPRLPQGEGRLGTVERPHHATKIFGQGGRPMSPSGGVGGKFVPMRRKDSFERFETPLQRGTEFRAVTPNFHRPETAGGLGPQCVVTQPEGSKHPKQETEEGFLSRQSDDDADNDVSETTESRSSLKVGDQISRRGSMPLLPAAGTSLSVPCVSVGTSTATSATTSTSTSPTTSPSLRRRSPEPPKGDQPAVIGARRLGRRRSAPSLDHVYTDSLSMPPTIAEGSSGESCAPSPSSDAPPASPVVKGLESEANAPPASPSGSLTSLPSPMLQAISFNMVQGEAMLDGNVDDSLGSDSEDAQPVNPPKSRGGDRPDWFFEMDLSSKLGKLGLGE